MKDRISRVLRDQALELEEGIKGKRVVEREGMPQPSDLAGSRLIKVTVGPRRAGKSFFTHLLLRGTEFAYANFDDPLLADSEPAQVMASLTEVYGTEVKTVFLDEIQNMGGWELFVNRLQRAGYNVFITGSNARLLSREIATHLTGRHIPIELFPFSFREFMRAIGFAERPGTTRWESLSRRGLTEFIERGGFPEIVVGGENPKVYLRQLYNDVIEKDIIFRHNIAYRSTFREIAATVVSNYGRYVTSNGVRKQFNISSDHTAKNYLSYLAESYLVLYINKISPKPREVERAPRKAYCIDTGMAKAVSVRLGEDFGRLMENLVAVELMRRRSYWKGMHGCDVYYWRDYQGNEVDFVVKEGGEVKRLVQVTYASGRDEVERRELRALEKASGALGCGNMEVITWDYEGEEAAGGRRVRFVPLWKWLLEERRVDEIDRWTDKDAPRDP